MHDTHRFGQKHGVLAAEVLDAGTGRPNNVEVGSCRAILDFFPCCPKLVEMNGILKDSFEAGIPFISMFFIE